MPIYENVSLKLSNKMESGTCNLWIYTWQMVLEWPIVGDTGEETLLAYCAGLLGHRTSH